MEAVLTHISSLSEDYKSAVRIYLRGLSILRNNVSHPPKLFSKADRSKLVKAKLGSAIDGRGNFKMTFEGYKLLLTDIIGFFDNVYAHS